MDRYLKDNEFGDLLRAAEAYVKNMVEGNHQLLDYRESCEYDAKVIRDLKKAAANCPNLPLVPSMM